MVYETLANDLHLVLFEDGKTFMDYFFKMSSRQTMDRDNVIVFAADPPTIHVIYKQGYYTICVSQLPYFTGSQFQAYMAKMYNITGQFYMASGLILNLEETLVNQGCPLFGCYFMRHESALGMTIEAWCPCDMLTREVIKDDVY